MTMHEDGYPAVGQGAPKCLDQCGVVGQGARFDRWRPEREAYPTAAQGFDPLLAFRRTESIQNVNRRGDFAGDALEQQIAVIAVTLAAEQGQAGAEYERDSDQPDQHEARKERAWPGNPHGLSPLAAVTVAANT